MFALPTPTTPRALSHDHINAMAEAVGSMGEADPMGWARRLGFALLPCGAHSRPEWDLSTVERAAFDPWPSRERGSLAAAVARGLLLRAGVAHGRADVAALAARFLA